MQRLASHQQPWFSGRGVAPALRSGRPVCVQVAFSGSEPSTHAPQGQSLVYAPASRKQLRKQLEQSFKQSRKSLKKPPQFVSERSEAGALVVDQLLGELRRLELWQVAEGSPCEVQRSPPSQAATQQRQHHHPHTHQHSHQHQLGQQSAPAAQVATLPAPPSIDFDSLDLSDPVYAPRNYSDVQGRVLVCQGSKCRAKGALGVLQAVSAVVGSSEDVAVLPCKCLGKCKQGPVVRVKQDGVVQCSVYTHLEPQQIPAILDTHFAQPVPQQQSGSVGAECCTDCHTGSTVQQPTSILAASLAASADLN